MKTTGKQEDDEKNGYSELFVTFLQVGENEREDHGQDENRESGIRTKMVMVGWGIGTDGRVECVVVQQQRDARPTITYIFYYGITKIVRAAT